MPEYVVTSLIASHAASTHVPTLTVSLPGSVSNVENFKNFLSGPVILHQQYMLFAYWPSGVDPSVINVLALIGLEQPHGPPHVAVSVAGVVLGTS